MDRILNGDEGATTRATDPPLPKNRTLVYQDGLYELDYRVVEQIPATTYFVTIDPAESVTEREAIRFTDLPAVDQAKFTEKGLGQPDMVGFSIRFRYTDNERRQSVLVPEPEYSYITWEDGPAATWGVDQGHETTLHSYQYFAEQVGDVTAYGKQLRERFGVALSDLSDAQRDIVDTAITNEEYAIAANEDAPSELVALAAQFSNHEHAHDPNQDLSKTLSRDHTVLDGPYIVRYDGEAYWSEISINRNVTMVGETLLTIGPDRDTPATIQFEVSMSDAMPLSAAKAQVRVARSLIGQEREFTYSKGPQTEINVEPGETKQASITNDPLDLDFDRMSAIGIIVEIVDSEDRLLEWFVANWRGNRI